MRLAIVAVLMAAASAFAEVRQNSDTFVARTNATSAVAVTDNTRGTLYRIKLDVSGTAKTNNLVIADTDGSVILSNAYVNGTTYVSFTNNPVPFVGLIISTFSANTTAVTNTITYTYER